jgi:hypothetical protein
MNDNELFFANITVEQLEAELAKRKKVKQLAEVLEKNPLKCEEVTTINVDSSDLEFFIRNLFGVEYESASVEESSNDTQRHYSVRGFDDSKYNVGRKAEVEKYLFNGDKKEPALAVLLNYLADKNYIGKGDYTVKWSW